MYITIKNEIKKIRECECSLFKLIDFLLNLINDTIKKIFNSTIENEEFINVHVTFAIEHR